MYTALNSKLCETHLLRSENVTVPPVQRFVAVGWQTTGGENDKVSSLVVDPAWKNRYFRPMSKFAPTG